MKNFKLLKEYYKTLSSTGKIVFILIGIAAAYALLELLS
tara:strand:+ start:477 stop:593 length:117 start_codon:yes stop_codon:yes gene_type:complete